MTIDSRKMVLREKDRDILIVVLDGMKISGETKGVAPLRCALREVVGPENEVIVLTIFNSQSQQTMPSPLIKGCCLSDGKNSESISERDKYMSSLRDDISLKTEAFMKIFRPFYDRCKSSGVKFTVKIVAGSEPQDIIVEEVDSTGATWVVLERTFASDTSVHLRGKACKLSVVGDNEDIVLHTYAPLTDGFGSSAARNLITDSNCLKLKKKSHHQRIYCILPTFEDINQPSSSSSTNIVSTSGEGNNLDNIELIEESQSSINEIMMFDHVLGMPLQLSWEVISEVTYRFNRMICDDPNEGFQMYRGYLLDRRSHIFVKRYTGGDFSRILEGEKRAAITMFHKNIMGLVGYHQNENALALVFPYSSKGTLMDRFLLGSGYFKIVNPSFHSKMKIIIGIAQGLCYMHEECPQGPIVHGDLRPCNILLRYDLQPMITGFGKATWIKLEEAFNISDSCRQKHPSDLESLALVKSDVLAFGILVLRLFCRKTAPQDNKGLVEWARPLLARRAYLELYEEDMEYDVYGIFRVTCVASHCINTKQYSRPCMSQIVAYLRGAISCAVPLSPLSDGSPNVDCTS